MWIRLRQKMIKIVWRAYRPSQLLIPLRKEGMSS
jgi:hypothetical protein